MWWSSVRAVALWDARWYSHGKGCDHLVSRVCRLGAAPAREEFEDVARQRGGVSRFTCRRLGGLPLTPSEFANWSYKREQEEEEEKQGVEAVCAVRCALVVVCLRGS